MIQGTPCAALFWYVHRPMSRGHDSMDGGFTVTLYENDTLTYTVFNALRQPMQQLAFPLPGEVREEYLRMVEYADWWMCRMPLTMRASHPPQSGSMFGFAGHPMFVVEELEETAFLPFATQKGHCARRLFLLLEDVSELLARYGLYLEPQRFSWDGQQVYPITLSGPMGPY